MKGLIIKDLYILKKSLRVFLAVSVGVMVLGILFMLSCRYGNIARFMDSNSMELNSIGEEAFFAVYKGAILMVLIIPMAFLSMIKECFKEDDKAGFGKVLGTIPVTERETVTARYLTLLMLSGIGIVSSAFTGFMVSLATPEYSLSMILGYTCSIFCIILIYIMLVMPLFYYFGGKHADNILLLPLIIGYFMIAFFVISRADRIENIDAFIFSILNNIDRCFREDIFFFFLGVLGIGIISFALSCLIYRRKKKQDSICKKTVISKRKKVIQ